MEQRSVLVTGASTGIGKETVHLLAREGFHVFAGVRKSADGEALEREAAGVLVPVIIDVTDEASIRAAAQTVGAALGPDESFSLVNNAGIAVAAPLELLSIQDLRRQFEVNLFGQVAVTQAFLPLLRARKGRIVFMGSIFGRIAVPLAAPYSAAKFALEAVADAFAVELHPWRIRVTILEPGNIATPIWEKFTKGTAGAGRSEPSAEASGREVARAGRCRAPRCRAPRCRAGRAVRRRPGKHGKARSLLLTLRPHAKPRGACGSPGAYRPLPALPLPCGVGRAAAGKDRAAGTGTAALLGDTPDHRLAIESR